MKPKVDRSSVSLVMGGKQTTWQLKLFPQEIQHHLTCAGSSLGCGCPSTDERSQGKGTCTPNGPPEPRTASKGTANRQEEGTPAPCPTPRYGSAPACLQNEAGTPDALLRTAEPPLAGEGAPARASCSPSRAPPATPRGQRPCPAPAWRRPEASPPGLKELRQRGTKQRKTQAHIPPRPA